MKEIKSPNANYIFYLQTKPELENSFYILAEIFSKINISLLPISADDLKGIERNKKQYLIILRDDLSSAYSFTEIKKYFVDIALQTGKLALFDISSFSEIENASKYQKNNAYKHFPLPQNMKQVAMTIAVDYFRDRNNLVEWPGGRRSKLPHLAKPT